MRKFLAAGAAVLALSGCGHEAAFAAPVSGPTSIPTDASGTPLFSTTNPGVIDCHTGCSGGGSGGGGGGSSSPFYQDASGINLALTTANTSVNTAIGGAYSTLRIYNPDTLPAHCKTGSSNAVTAAATDAVVNPGTTTDLTQASTDTYIACTSPDAGITLLIVPGHTVEDKINSAANAATSVESSGAVAPMIQADIKFAPPAITTATSTKIISGTAAKQTYIGHLRISVSGAAQTVQLEEGTGTNCGTGTATMGEPIQFGSSGGGSVEGGGVGYVYKTATAGDDVCAVTTTTAATNLGGMETQQ